VSFVSEVGEEADHLYLHCYGEGYGKKGGINDASMIMKSLKKLGILQSDSNEQPILGNELNIVMYNCGGQNKNNHVSTIFSGAWIL
jgi:hypothetical protein